MKRTSIVDEQSRITVYQRSERAAAYPLWQGVTSRATSITHDNPKLTMRPTALPAIFAHCLLIKSEAMVMSIIGGLLIYATIISFTMFFQVEEEF